jgi:hypothetical protein
MLNAEFSGSRVTTFTIQYSAFSTQNSEFSRCEAIFHRWRLLRK